ncbi:hypothetical protein NQ314_008678 [Rhamnusium bicolor]|uniref:Uncharacterized protein n=1 Tax=Rhamnusium bicolor TaxID=1586634 RepID=A0AAV8Y897_9CUCU|nr:hypothetical protein NQ314_008678 [Rhamnusium bicolor]
MFKLVVAFPLFFAAVNAGFLGSPIAYSTPVVAAPVAHVAHVAHVAPIAIKTAVPVATSYANTYKISGASVPVVAAAPVFKAAPVAFATPIVKAPLLAAPAISYAAPTIVKSPLLASHVAYGHY